MYGSQSAEGTTTTTKPPNTISLNFQEATSAHGGLNSDHLFCSGPSVIKSSDRQSEPRTCIFGEKGPFCTPWL